MGKYIEGCNIYQRMKNRTEGLVGKLKLSEVSEKLWIHLIVAGKDIILVVSRSQEANLVFSTFFSHFLFYFLFIFFYSIFRTRIRVKVMRSHCHKEGHIR